MRLDGMSIDISALLRQPFTHGSRVDPNAPALALERDRPLTYGEIAARVNRYANALLEMDVGPGDRVALLLYNAIEYWIAYLAITRIGAIAVRLNFRLTADELTYAIRDSGSSVLLGASDLLDRIGPARPALPVQHYVALPTGEVSPAWAHSWAQLESGSNEDPAIPRPSSTAPAMLMYTSGTTGRPKGALWTHANTVWFTAMQLAEWGFNRSTVVMVCGPLYHVGAVEDFCLPTLFSGGCVVFMRSGGFTARWALTVAATQGVTDLALFPSMIYELLHTPDIARTAFGTVRRVFTGGDPMLPWATEAFRERFPGLDLIQVYGLTEGTPIATCGGPGAAFDHPRSVGRAMPFCEISLRDDNGREVARELEGEIWTRSPANSSVYWDDPAATAETFVDGWCRTGDLGIVDEGGLCVTGRKKDMIRSGGENIYPAEIEDVLVRHPKIREAAVIGVPDEKYVETVCAIVVVVDARAMTRDEVIAHCTSHLAAYKKPRHVCFVDELPRTASSKVQKYVLRERFAADQI